MASRTGHVAEEGSDLVEWTWLQMENHKKRGIVLLQTADPSLTTPLVKVRVPLLTGKRAVGKKTQTRSQHLPWS